MENIPYQPHFIINSFLILFYENLFLIVNKTQFASIVENIKLRWLLQLLGLKS